MNSKSWRFYLPFIIQRGIILFLNTGLSSKQLFCYTLVSPWLVTALLYSGFWQLPHQCNYQSKIYWVTGLRVKINGVRRLKTFAHASKPANLRSARYRIPRIISAAKCRKYTITCVYTKNSYRVHHVIRKQPPCVWNG
jgi:hypothetical protein